MKTVAKHLCLISLLLSGFVTANAAEANAPYYPGRILVKPKQGISLKTLGEFNKLQGIQSTRILNAANNDWHIINFNPLENVHDKIKEYLKSGMVEYAEPDYIRTTSQTIPDDPAFKEKDKFYHFEITETLNAWDTSTGSSEVIVAVVDSGVSYQHEDLIDNMWINEGEIPGDGIDNDNNGIVDDVYGASFKNGQITGDPQDDHGHGTHVSGIIGGHGNNGIGVAGVNWNVRIIACKALHKNGNSASGTDSDIIEAIAYARKNNAQVINMSLGGPGYNRLYLEELRKCQEANILFVCAAGNETSNNDTTPNYPSNYCTKLDNIISVGSSDSEDNISTFSNYGAKTVHLFAPGTDIWSTIYKPDNPNFANSYDYMSGTSMACPFVAGVAALCISQYGENEYSYKDIKDSILYSVDSVPAMKRRCTTGGRINTARAIRPLETPDGFRYLIQDKSVVIVSYSGTNTVVTIPSDINNYPVVSINHDAFNGNTNITSVTISDTVLKIEENAFANCSSITNVIIGQSVETIETGAFTLCSSLTEINIPASVTLLSSEWAVNCSSLENINVDPANENYSSQNGFLLSKNGEILLSYPPGKALSTTLPESVNTIGESAFSYVPITSFEVPDTIRRINQYAFSYCDSLTNVICSTNFTSLGVYAFYGCSSLQSITFLGNAPAAMDISFAGVSPDFVIYYDDSTIGWEIENDLWHGIPIALIPEEGDSTISSIPSIRYSFENGKLILTYTGVLYSSQDNKEWTRVKEAQSPYEVNLKDNKFFYRVDIE